MADIRTRFAPSPTGYLQIGGARTALFNLLFARRYGGRFILPIEDTDPQGSTPEAIEAIVESLKWLDLAWDEGPFFQTQRFDLYKEKVRELLAAGKAYPCTCTAEELEKKRQAAMKEKQNPMSDAPCRPPDGVIPPLPEGKPYTIRFRGAREGTTIVDDLVQGRGAFEKRDM